MRICNIIYYNYDIIAVDNAHYPQLYNSGRLFAQKSYSQPFLQSIFSFSEN